MGCPISKLENEEVVRLCRERRNLIKLAVEHRSRLASAHIAYFQSLETVSAALRAYIDGRDEPHQFSLDSFVTPPFTPVKKSLLSESNTTSRVDYFRPGGNPAVSVKERPQSPETVQVETYYSPVHHYGIDNFFFAMQSPPASCSVQSYSPNDGPDIPPPSSQASQWDFFWNPFSSLDYYGYPNRASLGDDEIRVLQPVRQEQGIRKQEQPTHMGNLTAQRAKISACSEKEVLVEHVDGDGDHEESVKTDRGTGTEEKSIGVQTQGGSTIKISGAQKSIHIEAADQQNAVGDQEANKEETPGFTVYVNRRDQEAIKEETPGFTVYVNRRPTSMAEVIKDLEDQFMAVCNASKEISTLLETSEAQDSSTPSDFSAMKLLNPVALIRSASSLSASSRLVVNSSSSKDESCGSTSDFSEESMFSGSHRSTLGKLYAWEKKLFQEVKSGEKLRIAYEKKCKHLRNLKVNGADPTAVDKTRTAIRDLHTQISVSMHTVETTSERIETLRDEELQPQLIELVQGLSRMWKVMAEFHQRQKLTLDEAKLLLAGTPTKQNTKHSGISLVEPQRLARLTANLEIELRSWRACFETWIASQRSYVHALAGWLLVCVQCDPDASRLPFSPLKCSGTLPIIGLCIQWARSLDDMRDTPVLDGLDFFAAGVGSLYAQQLKENSRVGSKRYEQGSNMEVAEFGHVEGESIAMEKMAEVAIRVLCAGMSVSSSSLAEFAIGSAEGYDMLVKQCENVKWPQQSSQALM